MFFINLYTGDWIISVRKYMLKPDKHYPGPREKVTCMAVLSRPTTKGPAIMIIFKEYQSSLFEKNE